MKPITDKFRFRYISETYKKCYYSINREFTFHKFLNLTLYKPSALTYYDVGQMNNIVQRQIGKFLNKDKNNE